MLVGIGGSFIGGFAGWFTLGDGGPLSGFVLSLAGAAFVVWHDKNQTWLRLRSRLSSDVLGS